MHFGEENNTGYVRPEYVAVVNAALAAKKARPFLSDTNTLYRGMRTNCRDHLKIAYEHGFTPEVTGAPVIIPDDTKKENLACLQIDQRFIKQAKVAKVFLDADVILGIAHFKGHMMTGFGAALKNIGMGCASRKGKLEQHSDVSPIVYSDKCVGCGQCIEVCPAEAITLKKDQALINNSKCIGCASCLAACPEKAIDVDWEAGSAMIQEKMIEYTYAVLRDRLDRAVFLNFAIKITQECDCLAGDDPRIAPDIGILASRDPVSLDQACYDLAKKASGKDIFKQVHPKRDANRQLAYAAGLGLGQLDYKLIKVS
ncbi:DUF362 domain-containing protein [Candidatus Omnitrophota bacterium]